MQRGIFPKLNRRAAISHCAVPPLAQFNNRSALLSDRGQRLCCGFQFYLPGVLKSLLFAELQSLLRGETAMRKLIYKLGNGIGLALLSSAALAATQEELLTTIMGQVQMYVFIAFVIVVIAGVYFMRSRDKRQTPLNKIFEKGEAIHSVGPDTPVTECVRLMTAGKIGALIVMDGGKLIGIFTERDALNKVLAGGLDPGNTKVSEVMTRNPYCISPTTTVGDAMKLITKRRFRHLPIVDNGKVLAVVSSGDLTHWLVQDQMGEVQELVDLAARS
jgi:CBS domain-containing protein